MAVSAAIDLDIAGAGGGATLVERAGTPPATPPWIVGPIRNWLTAQESAIRNWLAQQLGQLGQTPPVTTPPTPPTTPATILNDFGAFFATLVTAYDVFSTSQGAPTIQLVAASTADAMNLHANTTAGNSIAEMFLSGTLPNTATGRVYDARLQIVLDRDGIGRLNNFFWLLQTFMESGV